MICVGIDVAKEKHDCYIANSDGEVFYRVEVTGFDPTTF